MAMRGLTMFISDLRNCRVRDLEEKRINKEMANIRSKFKEGNLTGYDRKKYVCKLLYIYILGWQVDFGHLEAVNLISSTKYSEKQIGYLAIMILLNENNEFLRLAVNSLRKDLQDLNEINNCLALQCVGNIGSAEFAEALGDEVQKLLMSPDSNPFVKRKAILATLRLYRKNPEFIPAVEWASKLVKIMEDPDLGIATSAASLLTAVIQQNPEAYKSCINVAIDHLFKLVISGDYQKHYVYYKVPNPWLQVKLLRLLQYFPSLDAPDAISKLETILTSILRTSSDMQRSQQQSNAQQAVLFEAINLAIGLNTNNSSLIAQCTELLVSFVSGKETNTRYLGLEAMCHLAIYSESLDVLKGCYDSIIEALNDKDTSIRRRALDLVYVMCDQANAKALIGELLKSLATAEFSLREEMVLKIAILAEKFAPDSTWYIDTMLQLITHGSDQVNEDVWYRVVQVVVNNEAVRTYATHSIMETLRSSSCPEISIKIGGYLLGEFSHFITDQPNCSPLQMLMILHSKFQISSLSTRAILLSTYVKFVNLFPEIKPEVLEIFRQLTSVLDSELQQRACEYYALCSLPTDQVLQTVCDEMPKFSERKSGLVSKLQKKEEDTEDKRTWKVLEKDKEMKAITTTKAKALPADSSSPVKTTFTVPQPASNVVDLLGLDEPPPVSPSANQTMAMVSSKAGSPSLNLDVTNLLIRKIVVANDGVLFEDSTIQIGVKAEYHGPLGRLALYIGNKSTQPLSNFTIQLGPCPELTINCIQSAGNVLTPYSQVQHVFNIECVSIFTTPPQLSISYNSVYPHEPPVQWSIPLPLLIIKFAEPIQMNKQDFVTRWQQLGGPPKEAQFTVQASATLHDKDALLRGFLAYGCGHCDGIDPNPNNDVFASIINTSSMGRVGILIRLEMDPPTKMVRFTVRASNAEAIAPIESVFKDLLLLGI